MNSHQEDLLLFSKIQGDHADALELLFSEYYVGLCRFATYFLNNPELAEETVSDVFINIWHKRKSIQINHNVKVFLFKATKFQAICNLKSEKGDWDNLNEDFEPDSYNPIESLRFQEANESLGTIIDLLPSKRKTIFQLSRFEGFTYSEIANILSISVKTVENQMGEALKQIKIIFDSQKF